MKDIETVLLEAIEKSLLSYRALAKEADISAASLNLFVNRKRSLTLGVASKLAKALKLELRPIKPKGK